MRSILFVIVAGILLTACKTVKYVPVERIVRETVSVRDTVLEVQLEQVHDSISVNLSKDTASYLENRYAYSFAGVVDGHLIHSLGTQKEPVPVGTKYMETIRTDSIPYPVEVKIPGKDVIIHRPTFWQIVSHIGIGVLIAAILGFVLFKK
jgi:hypothetical protein